MSNLIPENHRAILLCTNRRGVFFGYVPNDGPTDDELLDGRNVHLHRARMCVRWTSTERGIAGLAAVGPSNGCRIGYPADVMIKGGGDTQGGADGVHAIWSVSDEAVERWESQPWE